MLLDGFYKGLRDAMLVDGFDNGLRDAILFKWQVRSLIASSRRRLALRLVHHNAGGRLSRWFARRNYRITR